MLQHGGVRSAQPIKKHVFTAGFGLAHFTTWIIIALTHNILAALKNIPNAAQVIIESCLLTNSYI